MKVASEVTRFYAERGDLLREVAPEIGERFGAETARLHLRGLRPEMLLVNDHGEPVRHEPLNTIQSLGTLTYFATCMLEDELSGSNEDCRMGNTPTRTVTLLSANHQGFSDAVFGWSYDILKRKLFPRDLSKLNDLTEPHFRPAQIAFDVLKERRVQRPRHPYFKFGRT